MVKCITDRHQDIAGNPTALHQKLLGNAMTLVTVRVSKPANRLIYINGYYAEATGNSSRGSFTVPSGGQVFETLNGDRRVDNSIEFRVRPTHSEVTVALGPVDPPEPPLDQAGTLALSGSDVIPASDRVVRLDHNAPEYQEAKTSMAQVAEAARGSNDIRMSQEDRLRISAELSAGIELLNAPEVRVGALIEVLVKALRWLLDKCAGTVVGTLAGQALHWVEKLLGMVS